MPLIDLERSTHVHHWNNGAVSVEVLDLSLTSDLTGNIGTFSIIEIKCTEQKRQCTKNNLRCKCYKWKTLMFFLDVCFILQAFPPTLQGSNHENSNKLARSILADILQLSMYFLKNKTALHSTNCQLGPMTTSFSMLRTYAADILLQISRTMFDETHVVNLKENGGNIAVTNINRQEFVDLYVDYLLNTSITRQFNALSRGFHKVSFAWGQKYFPISVISFCEVFHLLSFHK